MQQMTEQMLVESNASTDLATVCSLLMVHQTNVLHKNTSHQSNASKI